MSFDLERDLPDLGAYAKAAAPTLPTGDLVHQLRRRRAVRTGLRTAGAVAVVAAVVAVGVTFTQLRDPVPPAVTPTPSPVTTAEPSPTATPVAFPTGDALLPFGVCGSLVGSPTASPVDDRFEVITTLESAEVQAGQALRVRASVTPAGSATFAEVGTLPQQGPTYLVVQDDVVVAVTDLYRGERDEPRVFSTMYGFGVDLTRFIGGLELSVCSVEGQPLPPEPLPAGDYELYALAPITTLGDVDPFETLTNPPAPSAGQAGTVLGRPVPFRVTGQADGAADPAEPTSVELPVGHEPACGGPAPVPQGAVGFLELTYPATALWASAEDGSFLDATMTYVGPGRVDLSTVGVTGWLVRDGVVVGTVWFQGDFGYQYDMDRGSTAEVGNTLPVSGCDGTSAPPPEPGEYLLYPSLTASIARVTGRDGSSLIPADGAEVTLIGEPVQFTVRP